MSQEFTNRVVLKMQDGTTRGDQHLCMSCSYSLIRRGVKAAHDVQVCFQIAQATGGRSGVIDGPVASCSRYYPQSLPQLHQLEDIAWEITTSGRTVGFITPEDRRRAGIGFGYQAPPAGVPR